MRILHLCLANFYIDQYNYQENVLPMLNKQQGHDVLIIASTETYIDNSHLGYVAPSRYVTEYGVPIIRLPYKEIGNQRIQAKLRLYKGLLKEIESFKPDVIMSHDLCYLSISEVIKYKKKNPEVKLYADTHTAAFNSGRNWVSLHILHRVIYKHYVQKAVPYLEKYFYLSSGEKEFSINNYRIPENLMEFYPLGGILPSDEEYWKNRNQIRKELGVRDREILLLHSGKLDSAKRTVDLLKAFSRVTDLNARLVIIGSIPNETKNGIMDQVQADKRVVYLGWKSPNELRAFLCAADLYLQPGSVSATMQNATCCRCPIMSFPHPSYIKDFDYGQFVWVRDLNEMTEFFTNLSEGVYDLARLRENACKCASEILDYNVLAQRICK